MDSDFCPLLRRLIDEHYGSRQEFLRAAEPGRDPNSSGGYLSKVLAGKAPPPDDRIESWADALGLTGDDRDLFLLLAALQDVKNLTRRREMASRLIRMNALNQRLEAIERRLNIGGDQTKP